jgi:WD40 repeat protein
VAFSSDSKYLASGAYDNTVMLWSIESQKEIATLRGHSSWINCVAFSFNGKYLASGSSDKTIKIWSFYLHKEVATFKRH